MPAEKGRSFVLKVGDGATPTEAFTTVGGMRSTSISLNNETVDVSDKDSNGWRELLAAAGARSVTVSGSGVFKDTASEDTVRVNALGQSVDNYEIVFESGDKFAGPFQITSLEYTGDNNDARQYSITLESAGAVTFTAV